MRSNAADGFGLPSSQARDSACSKRIEAALRDIGDQFVAVAIMTIGRRGADAGPARGFGEGETGRALLRDQFERRADQGFLEVAVVIAARRLAADLPPRCFDQLM